MLKQGLNLVGTALLFLAVQPGCTLPDINIPTGMGFDLPDPSASGAPASDRLIQEIPNSTVAWWSNVTIDSANNIYAVPADNNGIIKISVDGNSTRYFSGSQAWIAAKDSHDNIYVFTGTGGAGGSPSMSLAIHKLSPAGVISTFCNSSSCRNAIPYAFYGSGAVDSQGNLYFSFNSWSTHNTNLNSFIAKVSSAGSYSLLAGSFGSSCADGAGRGANFGNIRSMAIDSSDQLYILDSSEGGCQSIRSVTSGGVVATVHALVTLQSASMVRDSDGSFYYLVPILEGQMGAFIKKLSIDGTESTYCGADWSGDTSGVGDCSSAFIGDPSGFGMALDAQGSLVFNQGAYATSDNRLYRISAL